MTKYRNCQSCGMPLKRDALGGGTNADGSKSSMYCSHCFECGAFVLPDISVQQMQDRVQQKIAAWQEVARRPRRTQQMRVSFCHRNFPPQNSGKSFIK